MPPHETPDSPVAVFGAPAGMPLEAGKTVAKRIRNTGKKRVNTTGSGPTTSILGSHPLQVVVAHKKEGVDNYPFRN